jgi:inorganic pyrophosphatase
MRMRKPAQGSYAPRVADEFIHVVVEIPKGSRNKYEWDPDLNAIRLDRFLFSSVVYPTDYGFIPKTLAADGDPMDAMVTVSEPTFPGCVIVVKPIAMFSMSDDKGEDEKILCVPRDDPNWNVYDKLDDLSQQLRDEIAHFFSIYKQPEGKTVTVNGWRQREEAHRCIDASRRRYEEQDRDDAEVTDEAPRPAVPG